jgi:hypothetical protein
MFTCKHVQVSSLSIAAGPALAAVQAGIIACKSQLLTASTCIGCKQDLDNFQWPGCYGLIVDTMQMTLKKQKQMHHMMLITAL